MDVAPSPLLSHGRHACLRRFPRSGGLRGEVNGYPFAYVYFESGQALSGALDDTPALPGDMRVAIMRDEKPSDELVEWMTDVLNNCHRTGMILPYIVSSISQIASRRTSNSLAPPTITGGIELLGNITVKTGRRLSSVTFTVHRRKSAARSAKRENIVTRFVKSTALECASARSLTSLPTLSGKFSLGADKLK